MSDYACSVGSNSAPWDYWRPDTRCYRCIAGKYAGWEVATGVFVVASCRCAGSDPNLKFMGNCTYRVTFKMITDGLSKTLLIGEKHVPEGWLGAQRVRDCSAYNPDQLEVIGRFAGPNHPLARPGDYEGYSYNLSFGSWHPGVCQFALVDGSVAAISVTIDPVLLGYLSDRDDGNTSGGSAF